MKYVISQRCIDNILVFYKNVSKKYKHTYSKENMRKNVKEAYNAMYLIEKTLLRRRPTLERWQQEGWHMAHAGKWYYAYSIADDTITIEDACHEQNMCDTIEQQ